jgi:hypothetical protein
MANFAGAFISVSGGQITPTNLSSDFAVAAFVPVLAISLTSSPLAAARATQPAVSAVHSSAAGLRVKTFGGELFDKIVVSPRLDALGNIVTGTQFAVEVWNTFHESHEVLTAINLVGPGGLQLIDPYILPVLLPAADSFIFQVVVPVAGVPGISTDIVFVFPNYPTGADTLVTGSRLQFFSVAADWSEGIEESIEFLTDVLVAYSDNEQRRALRQLPRRALKYRALTMNALDAAGMESMIYGWQQQPFGVPFWPDVQPLESAIPVGTYVIPVATADRLFAPGGIVALFSNEYQFEALSIVSVASNAITCSSPTTFAWAAGAVTRVVPVVLCRLPASVEVKRFTSALDQVDVDFIGEAMQPAPAPSISPTQYKGFDVLEIQPNWAALPLNRTYKRSMVTIDPKVGPIEVIDKGGSPVVHQDFPWWLDTHPTITAFRAFILRRFGRLVPFWIPTWDQDLILAQNVLSTDAAINVSFEFYSQFLFPSTARRFLALIPTDGSANAYVEVVSSTSNGNGTETLTLSAAVGKAFTMGSTMISFLTLVRLASDRVAIKWDTVDHAEAVLALQEVPREMPA